MTDPTDSSIPLRFRPPAVGALEYADVVVRQTGVSPSSSPLGGVAFFTGVFYGDILPYATTTVDSYESAGRISARPVQNGGDIKEVLPYQTLSAEALTFETDADCEAFLSRTPGDMPKLLGDVREMLQAHESDATLEIEKRLLNDPADCISGLR
jgi:hypothetical protein